MAEVSNTHPYEQDELEEEVKIQPYNDIPMIDKIVLGPIKKYQKYNLFPWKLVLHIFLIIICTAQIIMVIGSTGSYSRSDQNMFYTFFMDPEIELEDVDVQRIKYIFDVDALTLLIRDSLDNYFGIEGNNNLFEDYELIRWNEHPDEEDFAQVVMDVFFLPGFME